MLTHFVCNNTNCQKLNNNLPDNYYTIDYVFTGKINPGLDSLFAVRYRFLKLHLNKFDKLIIQDSNRKRILDLNHTAFNDSIEIQNDGGYTYLIIKKYDKEDLPLVIQGIDRNGVSQDLLIRNKDGRILSTGQFKQMERTSNSRSKQFEGEQR